MLLRQTLLYLPAQVLGPLFQLAAAIVWTHYLTPSEIGVFALIVAAQELVHVAVLFWFSLYTIRYFDAQEGAAAQSAFLNTESAVLIGASAAAAIASVMLTWIVDAEWTLPLLCATIIYAISRIIVLQLSDRARAAHETIVYTVLQICWPVAGLFFALIIVHFYGAGTAAVLTGYAIAQILSIVFALYRLGFGRAPMSGSRAAVRDALTFGLPLVGGAMLIWVANNGIRFVVEHFEGAAAVGLLTVGWGLGLRAAAVASMLTTAAAFPIAMKRAREEGMAAGQSQLERNGVLLLASIAPAAAGLWAIAEPLVTLFIAEPFQETTMRILPMAILAGTVRSFRVHFGEQIFLLHERPIVPLLNDIVDAVLTLAGCLIGLTYMGLAGAADGATIAAIVSLVITLYVGWQSYRFGLSMADYGRILAAACIMGLVVHAFQIPPTPLGLAAAITGGAALYAGAIALLYPEGLAMLSGVIKDMMGRPR